MKSFTLEESRLFSHKGYLFKCQLQSEDESDDISNHINDKNVQQHLQVLIPFSS